MKRYTPLLLLVIVTLIAFASSLQNDFIRALDDDWLIIDNPFIRELNIKNIINIFSVARLDAYYQPLYFISFSLDYYFFKLDPFYYHLHNILLHIVNGVFSYLLVLHFSKNKHVAYLAVAFFLLHPIQVESVCWAVCRKNQLFLLFTNLNLWLYIKNNESNNKKLAFGIGILLTFICACLSRSMAVVLPALYCLIDYTKNWCFKDLYLKNTAIKILALFVVGALMLKTSNALKMNLQLNAYQYNIFDHIIIAFHSYSFYAYKVLFPVGFSPFYPLPKLNSPLPGEYYVGAFVALVMFVFFFYSIISRNKMIVFFLGYYLIMIATSVNIIYFIGDLPSTMADRFFYPGSLGMFAILSVIVFNLSQKNYRLRNLLPVLITVLLATFCWNQTRNWRSTLDLFHYMNTYNPCEEFLLREAMELNSIGKQKEAKETLAKLRLDEGSILINNPFFFNIHLIKLGQDLSDSTIINFFANRMFTSDLYITDQKQLDSLTRKILPIENDIGISMLKYENLIKHEMEHSGIKHRPNRLLHTHLFEVAQGNATLESFKK